MLTSTLSRIAESPGLQQASAGFACESTLIAKSKPSIAVEDCLASARTEVGSTLNLAAAAEVGKVGL